MAHRELHGIYFIETSPGCVWDYDSNLEVSSANRLGIPPNTSIKLTVFNERFDNGHTEFWQGIVTITPDDGSIMKFTQKGSSDIFVVKECMRYAKRVGRLLEETENDKKEIS